MFGKQPTSLAERIVRALARGDSARTTLSKGLGVSRTTLNRALAGLMEAGFVTARSHSDGRQGRPPESLHLDRAVPYTAGIALSKAVGRAVVVNRVGEVLVAVKREVSTAGWCDALRELCDALLVEAGQAGVPVRVASVGVGVPVPVAGNEAISQCARRIVSEALGGELGAPGGVPGVADEPGSGPSAVSAGSEPGASRELAAGPGWPAVVTDNIVTMAAIGEACWGAGTGVRSLLYVQLSEGTGSCVVTPQLVTGGVTGVASELGHTVVPGLDGRCYCGKVGCVETVASLSAILDAAGAGSVEELARLLDKESAGDEVGGRDAGEGASDEGSGGEGSGGEAGGPKDPGGRPAHRAVVRAAHAVGVAAANAVLMTNPEMVVLGGPLPREVDFFVSEVHRSLADHLLPALGWDIDVVPSAMDEWSAARGAALVASQELALRQAAQILGGRA